MLFDSVCFFFFCFGDFNLVIFFDDNLFLFFVILVIFLILDLLDIKVFFLVFLEFLFFFVVMFELELEFILVFLG